MRPSSPRSRSAPSSSIWNTAWCASASSQGHPRIDGRDTKTVRRDQYPHRRARANARLGAVHPRRDAGAGRHHAGHRPRCADHRRPHRRAQRAVHAALQLPAVQRRRDRHDGLAEAARDRPRQPGQARRQGGHAGSREIPVCDSRGLGNPRVERLELHGFGLRHQPRAHGCGRADQGAGGRRGDGPGQGRRALPGAHRHPRRRGSPRRHGFQGGRHQRRHHRAADGHQDHEHHARDHEGRAGSGARRAGCTFSAR